MLLYIIRSLKNLLSSHEMWSQDNNKIYLIMFILDPENHQLLVETNLPTRICQGLC